MIYFWFWKKIAWATAVAFEFTTVAFEFTAVAFEFTAVAFGFLKGLAGCSAAGCL
jgi:hypothetical protein